MITPRVIPCLLLSGLGLVKTEKFKNPKYVGDPRNAVKIFNEKEVDELVILDIKATPEGKPPKNDLVREIVSEAFMPIAYGGGIRSVEDARSMLQLGIEKVVINTAAVEDSSLIRAAAQEFGSQSVVMCMDIKRNFLGRNELYIYGGRKNTKLDPVTFAKRMEEMGAGEIIVNSIDRDGTMTGYDIELIRSVTSAVQIPVIACGGAGKLDDFRKVVSDGGASAAAAGSFFVFYGKHNAVLISYPTPEEIREYFLPPEGIANETS